jgi:Glycosyltransferase family 87
MVGSRALRVLLPLVPMILAIAALWPLARPIEGVGDTFQFWFAGHLVATGRSPYDRPAWAAAGSIYGPPAANVAMACADPNAGACAWVYPPATAWLFAPFGVADVNLGLSGVNAFVLLTAFIGVLAAVVMFGPSGGGARTLLLMTAVSSHPFVYDIHAGHFIGLELLGVAAMTHGLRERRDWWLVFAVLALSLTPHLFIVLIPIVVFALVARRRWRSIAWSAAALFAVLIAGAIAQPEAFSAILERAGAKTALTWSTPWALAQVIAPAAPLLVFGALVGLAAIAAITVFSAAPPDDRELALISAGTALSLAVTPYAQPYDLLLLVPAIAFAARGVARAPAAPRVALLAALPLVYVGGTWFPLFAARLWEDGNRMLGLVPVLVLALAAIAWATPRRPTLALGASRDRSPLRDLHRPA